MLKFRREHCRDLSITKRPVRKEKEEGKRRQPLVRCPFHQKEGKQNRTVERLTIGTSMKEEVYRMKRIHSIPREEGGGPRK